MQHTQKEKKGTYPVSPYLYEVVEFAEQIN